jgi:hypothetical protein
MKTIIELALIISAFKFSLSFGILFTFYVLFMNGKLLNKKEQLSKDKKVIDDNPDEDILTENLKDVSIEGCCSFINFYKGCAIENYDNKFWRIMAPNGTFVEKIFVSEEQAIKEIDIMEPLLDKPKTEGRKVYNIRHVS